MNHTLAQFFIERLSTQTVEHVLLDLGQMCELLGAKRTEELSLANVVMSTDMVGRKRRKKSTIPLNKRFRHQGLGKFNRAEILNAIKSAKAAASGKLTSRTD